MGRINNGMNVTKRKIHIDFIKILAILLVIFNHTGNEGFLAYQRQSNLFVQIFQLFLTSFCKIAVPLYFICSGALLLGKEESIQKLWKKRVLKYIVITIVFTIFYYIFLSLRDNSPIDLGWILRTMYSSSTFSFSGSYWFLYSYIAFLIMLPILRIIAKHITREVMIYLLVLHGMISGILPILEFYFGLESLAISIPFVTNQVFFYPLIGYYLEKNQISFENNKKLFIACAGLSMISVISNIILSLKAFENGNPTENYLILFRGFVAILVYLFIRDICKQIDGERLQKVVQEISQCTFGIYLLHGFAFILINDVYVGGRYLDAWIKVLCVFVSSFMIVFVLRRIPLINKVL